MTVRPRIIVGAKLRGPQWPMAGDSERVQRLYYYVPPEVWEGVDRDLVDVRGELWRVCDLAGWEADPEAARVGQRLGVFMLRLPDDVFTWQPPAELEAGWYAVRVVCEGESGAVVFWVGSREQPDPGRSARARAGVPA